MLLNDFNILIYRFLAKLVDLFIMLALINALYPLGLTLSFLYSIFCDAFEGQSLGKRIFKLVVIDIDTKKPINFKQSAIRNIPFILFIVFSSTFFLWAFLIIIGIPFIILEAYLLITLESKIRLGDIIANTKVILKK